MVVLTPVAPREVPAAAAAAGKAMAAPGLRVKGLMEVMAAMLMRVHMQAAAAAEPAR